MDTKHHLEESLADVLEPGETIQAWRPVVANGKVKDSTYQTSLALLGPAVFSGAARGAVISGGEMPDHTNLVVITDRRVLWCNKSRFNSDVMVGGADSLGVIHSVKVAPARIALAKLQFVFHDRSVAQFDLPSDHKATEFVTDIQRLLLQLQCPHFQKQPQCSRQ